MALTEKFASQKEQQWKAFIQRTGLKQPPQDFGNTVLLMQKFLMPPIQASVAKIEFKSMWEKGESWSG